MTLVLKLGLDPKQVRGCNICLKIPEVFMPYKEPAIYKSLISQFVLFKLKSYLGKKKKYSWSKQDAGARNEFLKVLLELESKDFVSKSQIHNKPS